MRRRLIACCVAACAATGAAQTQFPVTLTATCGGGGSFFRQAIESAPDSRYAAEADLGATSAGACDASMLFAHACFWRARNRTRLAQFYDTGTPGDQGGITHSVDHFADRSIVRWPDAENRGEIDATWTATLTCRAAESAIVTHEWTLRNRTATFLLVELYAYADVDLVDRTANRTALATTPSWHVVEYPAGAATCPTFAEFRGTAPATWAVDFYPNLEVALTADSFTTLPNAALPLAGDDYTASFGWIAVLAPNATLNVAYELGRNALFCTSPASVSHYGPGSVGTTIGTLDVPSPGASLRVDLTGPPLGTASLMIGVASQNLSLGLVFPGCVQRLLVDPFVTLPLALDASGAAQLRLRGDQSPAFCGLTLYLQSWSIGAGGPSCALPLIHTDGLALTYGRP